MKTIALVRDGVVTNIAKWDGVTEWNPGAEFSLVDVTDGSVGIGWALVDGVFVAPVAPPEAL
jgi:hypothetical protein